MLRHILAIIKFSVADSLIATARGWLQVRVTLSPLRLARKSRTSCDP